MPPTIESSGNKMGLYLYSQEDHRKIRFWAYYERFVENEVKTENPTKIYPTLKPELNTGDQDSDDSGNYQIITNIITTTITIITSDYDHHYLYISPSTQCTELILTYLHFYCSCFHF